MNELSSGWESPCRMSQALHSQIMSSPNQHYCEGNDTQACPSSTVAGEAGERTLTGNADELGSMKGKEESWGSNHGYLFCWWGMCVCVVLLAGG